MNGRIGEILFDAEQIAARVEGLGRDLARMSDDTSLLLIGVLRGSFIFLADLVRALHRHGVQPVVDFVTVSSYGTGTVSSGEISLMHDLREDVNGKSVVLVDDILDTGRTLSALHALMRGRGARSVRSCVLLDKPARRKVPFEADVVGFTVPDVFVVGYGLDYADRFRELPYIARFDTSA